MNFEMFCKQCGEVGPFLEMKSGSVYATCAGCENKDFLRMSEKDPGKTDFVMPFGKHKGCTLDWIVNNDFDYARWAANNLNNDSMRVKFQMVLEQYGVTP